MAFSYKASHERCIFLNASIGEASLDTTFHFSPADLSLDSGAFIFSSSDLGELPREDCTTAA